MPRARKEESSAGKGEMEGAAGGRGWFGQDCGERENAPPPPDSQVLIPETSDYAPFCCKRDFAGEMN